MSFKVNRLVSAAYIAFGMAVIGASLPANVAAQSNATGTVYGRVPAGATAVVLENLANGAKRTVTPDATGRFQATALSPGRYKADLLKGEAVASSVTLEVLLGQGVEAIFTGESGQLQTVQIVGRAATIDVSSADNGVTFTSRQLAALPVQQNIDAIIQLAPNTTKADSRYAGGASIGGGAPSENSYYINGLPVTNALSQLGSIELPFGAISQAQVLTGGFGAEFGRSVGGVVSVTTKSGSNEWEGGVSFSIEPNKLRAKKKDIYYPNTGTPENANTDGTIYFRRSDDTKTETTYGAHIGGPIIKDKLFFFFAGDRVTTKREEVAETPQSALLGTGGFDQGKDVNKKYLGKFDWLITDDHRVELTLIGDNWDSTDNYFGYDYNTRAKGPYSYTQYSKNLASYTPLVGGQAQVAKYTGNLTQDLTVTALYGQTQSKHEQTFNPPGLATGLPGILWTSNGRAPGLNYFNPQPLAGATIIPAGAEETTKSFRFDLEYKLGKHTIRAGLDENRLKSENAGDLYAGVSTYSYRFTATPTTFTPRGATTSVGAAGGLGTAGYYVRERIFNDVTNAESNQSAQYIEDKFQVTKDVLLTFGLRNESFKNKNGDGEVFLKSSSFKSPRFSGIWDVMGDSSLKLFGSAGRYSLQIPTSVAVRGASRSLFTDQYFTYTAIDPVTGAPSGTVTSLGAPFSANNEYGQAKAVQAVSAVNIKPTYQDEITLGIEKALTPEFTGGAKVTYRKLKSTIDDFCDQRPLDAYAANNGIDATNYGGFACASFNPGKSNTFLVDYSGTGNFVPVPLSATDLGFDKAKRTYLALDFFLEHPFKDGWYGRVNYTYSKSKGNTEGQTKSDNAQTNVALTSTWDFPEAMEGAYGLLPNDRKHQIKAYGAYKVLPEFTVGANLLLASGRPKNCFGNYNGSGEDIGYGNIFFYCDGQATPRGSQGRLPWERKLDLNFVYTPEVVKGLALRVDWFNVFNRQSAQVIDETREPAFDPATVQSTYGRVISYSTPAYVRLTVTYDKSF